MCIIFLRLIGAIALGVEPSPSYSIFNDTPIRVRQQLYQHSNTHLHLNSRHTSSSISAWACAGCILKPHTD